MLVTHTTEFDLKHKEHGTRSQNPPAGLLMASPHAGIVPGLSTLLR